MHRDGPAAGQECALTNVGWLPHGGQLIDAHNRGMRSPDPAPGTDDEPIHSPRLWRDNGWTATVIKNEDDDGWAVAMTPEGQAEPALVGPWTMGRDKKNPKPLDTSAFNTLVKTAAEFVRRHEQQLHATLHQQVEITHPGGRVSVTLDIEPDEENPTAILRAMDAGGEVLGEARVSPAFKLTRARAEKWADAGFSAQSVR